MKQIAPLEIGMAVIDLPRMLGFYVDVLGCKEVRRADIPAVLSSQIGVAEQGYTNVWLQFPGGEVVKLMQPPQPPQLQPRPDFLATRTGIAYMTLYCSDLAATLAAAQAQGASLLSQPHLAVQEGLKLAFMADPEGNVVELVQPG